MMKRGMFPHAQRKVVPLCALHRSLLLGACALAQSALSAAKIRSDFGNIPVYFEQNVGQTAPPVRYIARTGHLTAFITPDGLALAAGNSSVAMHVTGASTKAVLIPEDPFEGVS